MVVETVLATVFGGPKNEVMEPSALGFLASEVPRSPALRLRDMIVVGLGRRRKRRRRDSLMVGLGKLGSLIESEKWRWRLG